MGVRGEGGGRRSLLFEPPYQACTFWKARMHFERYGNSFTLSAPIPEVAPFVAIDDWRSIWSENFVFVSMFETTRIVTGSHVTRREVSSSWSAFSR